MPFGNHRAVLEGGAGWRLLLGHTVVASVLPVKETRDQLFHGLWELPVCALIGANRRPFQEFVTLK